MACGFVREIRLTKLQTPGPAERHTQHAHQPADRCRTRSQFEKGGVEGDLVGPGLSSEGDKVEERGAVLVGIEGKAQRDGNCRRREDIRRGHNC